MEASRETRRFRISPVELTIFSVVALICLNSIYNLFYEPQNFQTTALAPMSANPTSEGRTTTTSQLSFANLDVNCDGVSTQETAAGKVRLSGPLCGFSGRSPASQDTAQLVKTQIVNQANHFSATVFTDMTAGKFSTDYIPLNVGKNQMHVEFVYSSGRVIARDFEITKN